jgi:hypothetical protein
LQRFESLSLTFLGIDKDKFDVLVNEHCWDGGYYFDSDLVQDGRLQVMAHFQPAIKREQLPQTLPVGQTVLPFPVVLSRAALLAEGYMG